MSTVTAPASVTLDALVRPGADSGRVSFTWSFDDGSSDARGKTVTRLFFRPGVNTIRLTADNGRSRVTVVKSLRVRSDVRVFLDLPDSASADWPCDITGRTLKRGEIERAARLGLNLWQTILPDLRVRLVADVTGANRAIRFRDYRPEEISGGSALAFTPRSWSSAPDLACGSGGRRVDGAGRSCDESRNNIILFSKTWAADAADFVNSQAAHEYYTAGYPPPSGEPAWHTDRVRGADLAFHIAHEFGHTLVSTRHTHIDNRDRTLCTTADTGRVGYIDVSRRRAPPVDPRYAISLPFSLMYSGAHRAGASVIWNARGMYEADARWLRSLGWRVDYPEIRGLIKLAKPTGEVCYTGNWETAHAMMKWPASGGMPYGGDDQWYVVDVLPERPAVMP